MWSWTSELLSGQYSWINHFAFSFLASWKCSPCEAIPYFPCFVVFAFAVTLLSQLNKLLRFIFMLHRSQRQCMTCGIRTCVSFLFLCKLDWMINIHDVWPHGSRCMWPCAGWNLVVVGVGSIPNPLHNFTQSELQRHTNLFTVVTRGTAEKILSSQRGISYDLKLEKRHLYNYWHFFSNRHGQILFFEFYIWIL